MVAVASSPLREAHKAFSAPRAALKPGDNVKWKPGLRNRDPEGPFIVIEKLPKPVFDPTQNWTSFMFREPLDLIIGMIDTAGTFRTMHVDSRRIMKA